MFIITLTNCSILSKRNYSKIQKIKLIEPSFDNKEIWFQNKDITLVFSVKDVKDYIKSNKISANNLLECLNKMSNEILKINLPDNNFLSNNSCQEELFLVTNNLLIKGRVKILNNENNLCYKNIEYIRIKDFSGEQSYFRAGKISFMRYFISIGE